MHPDRSSSLASLLTTALVALALSLATGCANEDRAQPPGASGAEHEEVVRLASTVSVHDVRDALTRLRDAVEDHGGHVSSSDVTSDDAVLVARVPVASLAELREALSALDPEHTERESRTDVTREHADLTARLRASRATEERLLALLADRTASLADVLAAERELARVRAEIERAEAEDRTMRDDVAYASVEITLRERAIAWRDAPLAAMGRAFAGGLETTWSVLVSLAVITAALSPALVVLVALGVAMRRLRRALRTA